MNLSPEDALLCDYYGASIADDGKDGILTIEEIEHRHPKIDSSRLMSLGASLERLGWIESAIGGGHRITEAGRERYLEDT
jgi:predicted transcriptional regulator of viral defense system